MEEKKYNFIMLVSIFTFLIIAIGYDSFSSDKNDSKIENLRYSNDISVPKQTHKTIVCSTSVY